MDFPNSVPGDTVGFVSEEKYKGVRTYGDPVLRRPGERIAAVTDEIRALADRMVRIMREAHGVGLAAPQIGVSKSICVIEIPAEYDRDEKGLALNPGIVMPWVLINPVITTYSRRTDVCEEGCLSFPGISAPIRRAREIAITYTELDGRACALTVKEYLARAVQHEIDHLNGVLLADRMTVASKVTLARALREIKAETQTELGLLS